MAPRAHASPRSVAGGRSARYETRRAARGGAASRAYAPAWSDASAAATLAALHRSWKASLVQHMKGHCLYLMVSASRVETLAQSAEAGLSPDRREGRERGGGGGKPGLPGARQATGPGSDEG